MTENDSPNQGHEVADVLVEFDGHPDQAEIQELLTKAVEQPDIGASVLHVSEVLPRATRRMSDVQQFFVGAYLILLGLALLAVTPWTWSTAAELQTTSGAPPAAPTLLGMTFQPSPLFFLALLVMLTGALGSVAVLAMTFSSRSGHETLEGGYVWWYLTRPITGAALGLLFYMAVAAGFFAALGEQGSTAVVWAAAIGGLAGLFTDQVLAKMRAALGILPTNQIASDKSDSDTDDPT